MPSVEIALLAVLQGGSNSTNLSFPSFLDPDGAVAKLYRIEKGDTPVVYILDPNLRVLSTLRLVNSEEALKEILRCIETDIWQIEALYVTNQAPVLFVSNVLNQDICRTLIHIWETQGHEETGVEHSKDGLREDVVSHDTKMRKDHIVSDAKLMRLLTSTIGRRVIPELRKSFAFNATRFEGFKIACYDSQDGGFFHAHRDNLSPSTAHRRFVLTINLNDGYEGGHLRFSEYGPHLYRPEAGDALIFSSSHLHEVTPVSRDRRLTLLSFMFSDSEVRQSQKE